VRAVTVSIDDSPYAAWNTRCEALLHLVMTDPRAVVHWRMDAERARRTAGRPGLSDNEARDYVERFVPAYATCGSGPARRAAHPRGPAL